MNKNKDIIQIIKNLKAILEKVNSKDEIINIFLVKLLFLFFLNSIGTFNKKNFLINYLEDKNNDEKLREAFVSLFIMLETKGSTDVPYINGPFKEITLELPYFSDEFINTFLNSILFNFDWSKVRALEYCDIIEQILSSDSRQVNGMHFTSKENIHKVIDPLFMDNLRSEFKHILTLKTGIDNRLHNLLKKISNLKFLDPASGIGNFLIEAYSSLRKLEKEIQEVLNKKQLTFNNISFDRNVSIKQFYGIELNQLAALASKIVLYIADYQTDKDLIKMGVIKYIPFEKNKNIIVGNSLQLDWDEIVKKQELNYIFGNPPFIGARNMTFSQKQDLISIFTKKWHHYGNLDYVASWFKKALDFIQDTDIEVAFISTSSIVEGVSASALFKPLFEQGMVINFAYESFKWEQNYTAAGVYIVIIGFSCREKYKNYYLYKPDGRKINAKHINGYLIDGADVYAESREYPLVPFVPRMRIGNKPVDNGHYLFTEEEYNEFLKKEPKAKQFFKKFLTARDFIGNTEHYCLYLGKNEIEDFANYPEIQKRINSVKAFREKSSSRPTNVLANTPLNFHVENIPDEEVIAVPKTTTFNRDYIPIGLISPDYLVSDGLLVLPDNDLFYFGVLSSHLHLLWTRLVCGRLGNAYRYSINIVYNNFPWINATEEEKDLIRETAKKILDVRKKYEDISLKKLYDPKLMPNDLREAHLMNDRAVSMLYGFNTKTTDDQIIKDLLEKHELLITNEDAN